MDLNRVAIFVRVVEERGFTAAAKKLGLPKSSVSRSVALLEQDVGARLLRRSTRNVALTDAGAAFYERAAPALTAMSEAREAVVDLESSMRGPIRITAAVDAGVWMLAPLLAAFQTKHPEASVEVVLTPRVVDMVEEGFDLALRFGTLRESSLVARRLSPMSFELYASRGYLDAHGTPKRVADLAQHACLLFRAPTRRASWTLTGPKGDETVEVRGGLVSDDFSFVAQAARCGAGIALLPSFIAASTDGALVRVLPKYSQAGAPVHLVYASARHLPHRVAVLRDFLVEALKAERRKP